MPCRRHFGSARKLASGRDQVSYWHDGQRHIAPPHFPTKADAQAYLSIKGTDVLHGEPPLTVGAAVPPLTGHYPE